MKDFSKWVLQGKREVLVGMKSQNVSGKYRGAAMWNYHEDDYVKNKKGEKWAGSRASLDWPRNNTKTGFTSTNQQTF